jgi:hypothetical protein
MKDAVEIVSGAIIYIPSFIKFGPGIQKVIEGTYRQNGGFIILILFLKIRKVG